MQLNMCGADDAAVKHPRTEGRREPRLQLLARLDDKTAVTLKFPVVPSRMLCNICFLIQLRSILGRASVLINHLR